MPDHPLLATHGGKALLATHSGKFHCDEVFAYVVLRLALGLEPGNHTLVRTRDPAVIASADWVWDVGSIYDPAARRFDHHQRGAPVRPDGTPFSAAGLVWQSHGRDAIAALLRPRGAEGFAAAIADELDRTVVRRIDEVDNGVATTRDSLGFTALIGEFNPNWDDAEPDAAADAAFLQAAAMAQGFLTRRVDGLRARMSAEAVVVAAHAASADPRVLVLARGMPWHGAVFAHALPVLFAVYPVANGNWMVDAMPPEPGSFAQRLPLPAAWAGLQDAVLAATCGVPDAVFVHLRRFVGAARSRDGALAMAAGAMAEGTTAAGEITAG